MMLGQLCFTSVSRGLRNGFVRPSAASAPSHNRAAINGMAETRQVG